MVEKSLYERLGGYDAINAVVNNLLPRLKSDQQLGRFWEALAERIADAILTQFEAETVRITVRKPTPISGVLQFAGCRIVRHRDAAAQLRD